MATWGKHDGRDVQLTPSGAIRCQSSEMDEYHEATCYLEWESSVYGHEKRTYRSYMCDECEIGSREPGDDPHPDCTLLFLRPCATCGKTLDSAAPYRDVFEERSYCSRKCAGIID